MDVDGDTYNFEPNGLDENYQITENISIPVYADVQRYPCPICSRYFNVESLRKHQPICQKSSQKVQRKVFDMGKQRANDSDVPYAATRETTKFYHEGVKPKVDHMKKSNNNWREDHQTLVQTIRQARQTNQSAHNKSTNSKPTTTQNQNSNNGDYIQCEFCHRLFNKYSAERHIPFCETQFKRKQLQANNNNLRSPAAGPLRQGRFQQLSQEKHQINSAPSTSTSKYSPVANNGKFFRKPLTNSMTVRRTQTNETLKSSTNNGIPTKLTNFTAKRTSNVPSQFLLGTMKTGRTPQNGNFNISPADRTSQTSKNNSSPSPVRRTQQKSENSSREQKVRPTNENDGKENCQQCGEPFPVQWAKFCCECGQKRFQPE